MHSLQNFLPNEACVVPLAYISSFPTPRVLLAGIEGQLLTWFSCLASAPFVPHALGAAFALETFPWFLPSLHCGDAVLGPVPCWSQPEPADLTFQLDLRHASFTMDQSGSHWALGWPWLLSPDPLLLLWHWGTAKVVIKDSVPASIFLWFILLLLFSRCWDNLYYITFSTPAWKQAYIALFMK